VALAVVAAVAVFRWWRPSDERRIRAVLEALAEAASEPAGEGLEPLARAAALGRFFTEDVVVDLGPSRRPIEGRDTLVALAAQARPPAGGLRVRFVDVTVTVEAGGATATTRATALVRGTVPGDPEAADARELTMGFRKVGGAWLIARVAAVEPLERVR
jgi:ketosteroid isomerase-like protein